MTLSSFQTYVDSNYMILPLDEQPRLLKAQELGYDGFCEYIRDKRNKLLAETDWWALSDHTATAEQTTYRQALRDVPAQSGFPDTVTWPTKP